MTTPNIVLQHICEVCGLTENLTSEAGFDAGWDYPPRMGAFGVISPRTCPNCLVTGTLWWRLTTGEASAATLTEADQAVLTRINNEPASIQVTN